MTGRNNMRLGIGGPIAQGRGHMPKEEITLGGIAGKRLRDGAFRQVAFG